MKNPESRIKDLISELEWGCITNNEFRNKFITILGNSWKGTFAELEKKIQELIEKVERGEKIL